MSQRGNAWLEAHADGRPWSEGALLVDHGIGGPGSLPAKACDDGLALTGYGSVTGDMLWTVRDSTGLTVAQIAKRLGFTVQQWKLMEADERMVPDPDRFWERAMALVDEAAQECQAVQMRRS